MPISIKDLLYQFAQDMKKIFAEDFSRIVVYGSYARGDYKENSDVDVMIFVKIPEEQIGSYRETVSDCAFEYFMKYGIDISPIIKNEEHFKDWADYLPYYRSVRDEGVVVDAG